jgi:branched-chain amino acid transport system permease protein
VLAVAAVLFFSRTRTGVAVLAVSQEPTATSLVGISVNRISALTWGIAGFLGAPPASCSAEAAPVAPASSRHRAHPGVHRRGVRGITSLPGAFVGGVVIGVVERLAAVNLQGTFIPGADRLVVFLLLLGVLLVKPAGLLGKEA